MAWLSELQDKIGTIQSVAIDANVIFLIRDFLRGLIVMVVFLCKKKEQHDT